MPCKVSRSDLPRTDLPGCSVYRRCRLYTKRLARQSFRLTFGASAGVYLRRPPNPELRRDGALSIAGLLTRLARAEARGPARLRMRTNRGVKVPTGQSTGCP